MSKVIKLQHFQRPIEEDMFNWTAPSGQEMETVTVLCSQQVCIFAAVRMCNILSLEKDILQQPVFPWRPRLKFSRSKKEKSWVACVWSHCLAIWRKTFGCVKSKCKFMLSCHELAGINWQRQRGKNEVGSCNGQMFPIAAWAFYPAERTWTLMKNSGQQRALNSVVLHQHSFIQRFGPWP